MMFGILVIAVIFAALVAVRLVTRRRTEVLVVSGNRELASKRPATTFPTMVLKHAEPLPQRTDTVMMGAINPADYPWAQKV